jgi:hypothetical protein
MVTNILNIIYLMLLYNKIFKTYIDTVIILLRLVKFTLLSNLAHACYPSHNSS